MQQQYRHSVDRSEPTDDQRSISSTRRERSEPAAAPSANDSRPYWQRLDDEEDLLLIKRRKRIRRRWQFLALWFAVSVIGWLIR